uniref:Ribosomal RNA-processing protein 14/surfeit locus protein 6 C-terminal domain-containing protein n=1 Tax=Canis lupus familiaris TaxID=9615 RepID=A0A8C0RQL6_CANLF
DTTENGKISKAGNHKCWRGCGERGTLLHCWWECDLVQPPLENCVEVPQRLKNRPARVPGRVSGPAGLSSLLAKDAYLQGLARKTCSQPSLEPQKRASASKARSSEAAGPPKKKRQTAQKKSQRRAEKAVGPKSQALEKSPPASRAGKPAVAEEEEAFGSTGSPAGALVTEPDSLFALEKRRRRKQERDRKKRKRKELRAKEKVARAAEVAEPPHEPHEPPPEEAQSGLLFNKVEGTEEQASSKAQRRKEKRQKLKGNLTPLTGKNYRRPLQRLQARQARLDELRDQDERKARELESKMKWTNLLYKAQGVRIRDNEHLLQEALKRKEKRTAHVVERMQRRQDKRRQNLRKKKAARAEQRLEKAHRKGRILPQDLERAGLA